MFDQFRSFILGTLLVGGLGLGLSAAELPKARTVRELKDYHDILIFKGSEPVVFIKTDNDQTLVFGNSADDDNPQDSKAWNVFDVLYEDVPAIYELALALMAKGEWEEALKQLERCGNENTSVSKKKFSSTDVYANYVPHKYFLCYLNLGDADKTLATFEKILGHKSTHARIRVMLEALPLLIEKEKGELLQKVVAELKELSLSKRDKMEIALANALALSLGKKYAEAKTALNLVLDEYGTEFKDLASRIESINSTILVYHEKNYKAAIAYFEEIQKKSREKASADMYAKLGYCYSKMDKWEEARWNYIQAYLFGSFSKSQTLRLIESIEETNEHILPKESNAALSDFFAKVKKAP